MVKAELRLLRNRGLRMGRRQVSARLLAARRRSAGADFETVPARGVPVVARVDPALRLADQTARFTERVGTALREAGIGFWWLPAADRARRTLCLREADREAAAAVLAALAGPAWYAEGLTELGRPVGRLRAVGSLGRAPAPGWRIWEYVTAAAESGFLADERQGLAVHFWTPGPEGTLLASVPNLVATVLEADDCAGFGEVPAPLRRRQAGVVDFPVDVVYTWVDGADPVWLRTKAEALGAVDPQAFTERAQDDSRFADHDELRYSLRSLEQFAPWVNHVWIVTADQHPSWLRRDDPWISVVSHRDIFPDGAGLPTFNSHAIEACLHRIPGLSEHFLYLNDDMILGHPVAAEQFFHPSGLGKFFWSRTLVDYAHGESGEIASSTAAKNARDLLGERFGTTFARKFYHTAAALHVSELSRLESEFADVFAATRQATFRTVTDIAVAGSFYLNYGYLAGTLTPSRLRYDYVDPAAPDADFRLRRLLTRRFDAFCINDGSTAEDDEQRRRTDRVIRTFLGRYLPVPGRFETDAAPGPDTAVQR